MAHEIETFENQASFVSVREDAWHRLGTVVPQEMRAEEALRYAHLADWNVRKEELFLANGTLVPERFATVRDNPYIQGQKDILGVVGKKYEPIQNEDHAELLDALVGESGAHFETAGSLSNGKQTFITMKLPSHIEIGGKDSIATYIAALNSHDGSRSFQFIVTPVRIVCANTQAAAIRAAQSRFSVRHTKSGAQGIIAEARQALNMTFKYLDGFQQEAERMIEQQLDDDAFIEIISQLYPIAEDASDIVSIRRQETQGKLMELFVSSPTAKEIRGTAWGGYQAVTEYVDHYMNIQGKSESQMQYQRAVQVASGKADEIKARAFKLFASV